MLLPTNGVDFYALTIVSVPALTSWSASFDNGTTWVAGTPDVTNPAIFRWLLAGPTAPSPDPSATVISAEVVPLLRSVNAPLAIVRKGPIVAIGTPTL